MAQMHVCNAALKDSAPLVVRTPPPPQAVAHLREWGRKARLHGVGSSEPGVELLARFGQKLDRRLVFFHPSSAELSFDEMWLLNLFDAVRAQDHDRYCFAMRSRLSKIDAAELHFHVIKAVGALDFL